MSKKEQVITEETSVKIEVVKTGIVENKKTLESLAEQKVDGDNVLGGISVTLDGSWSANSNPGGGNGPAGAGD